MVIPAFPPLQVVATIMKDTSKQNEDEMPIINVSSSISYYGWVQIPDSGFTSDQNTLSLCSWKSLVESAKDPEISFTSIFNQTEKLCLTR